MFNNQWFMKKKVTKSFMEKSRKMEEQGDTSFLKELNCDQFVDYLFKGYDLGRLCKSNN